MQRRPQLRSDTEAYLRSVFDEDLAELGGWLGVQLSCDNFNRVSSAGGLEFVECAMGSRA